MKKPKEAIERLRASLTSANFRPDDAAAILAHLDSIPDDAHVCEWPKELTRERLQHMAFRASFGADVEILRALAAIAPERKKRMVNLWVLEHDGAKARPYCWEVGQEPTADGWRKVAGPVEIDG